MADLALKVEDLVVSFATEQGKVRAVDGISFAVGAGETLGIVGESGCGKSVTALSIMRLLPRPSGVIENGKILFGDIDLAKEDPEKIHAIRGDRIAMIFQEPLSALNPVHRIGKQLAEVYQLHHKQTKGELLQQAMIEMLAKVGISSPELCLRYYPHQLSGGMRQRIMIAIALACQPDILIADEPTTALDVTVQAQILELIRRLQSEFKTSVLFITHDLGVIAEMADHVIVMYGGWVVEQAPVRTIFRSSRHPYTKGLMDSIPRLNHPAKARLNTIPGSVPALTALPKGCRFQNRCYLAADVCRQDPPPPIERIASGHEIRCWRWRDL